MPGIFYTIEQLFAVVGNPARHSLSPAIHNSAFSHLGIKAAMVPLEPPPGSLEEVLKVLSLLGLRGLSVTMPFKEECLSYSKADGFVKRVGCANTLVLEEVGKPYRAHNTDGAGFVDFLSHEAGINAAGKSFTIVGAGGAARAVGAALADAQAAKIYVIGRSRANVERFLKAAGEIAEEATLETAVQKSDVLVNATPVGMANTKESGLSPVPEHLLREGLLVVDMIYNPPETPLLQAARKRGLAAFNGLGMLVHQAQRAFELFTGRPSPSEVMHEAVGL